MKISAFTIVSEPERLCYPYLESIKSWLLLVDELSKVGKEVWCMENWRDNQKDKEKVSDSHCGRWNYDLKKRFSVYYDFYTDWGQLFIKSKD